MSRPLNWPDLRSPKGKFQDICFVGTDTLINYWKFYIDRLRTVVTAQSQMFLEAVSHDLTWWPDLRWSCAETFREGAKRMHKRVCKKRWCCAPPFFRYPRKTWWGVSRRHPARRWLRYPMSISVIQVRVRVKVRSRKGTKIKNSFSGAAHDLWSLFNVEFKNWSHFAIWPYASQRQRRVRSTSDHIMSNFRIDIF